jgi:hypothetical protein
MSKWSKEEKEAIKDKARFILIRTPRISRYALARALGISEQASYDIKESILREAREAVSKDVIMDEIGRFQIELDALCDKAWEIIRNESIEVKMPIYNNGVQEFDKDGNPKMYIVQRVISVSAKTKAMGTIAKLRNMLLESKFSAGLFKKDWGNLGIDKMFDDKDKKLNELLDEVRKIKIDKDADNGVQNREGANVETSPSGDDGIRKDDNKTVS